MKLEIGQMIRVKAKRFQDGVVSDYWVTASVKSLDYATHFVAHVLCEPEIGPLDVLLHDRDEGREWRHL